MITIIVNTVRKSVSYNYILKILHIYYLIDCSCLSQVQVHNQNLVIVKILIEQFIMLVDLLIKNVIINSESSDIFFVSHIPKPTVDGDGLHLKIECLEPVITLLSTVFFRFLPF